MAGLVIDSSITLAWTMPDEPSPGAAIKALMTHAGAIVPAIWPFEVMNAVEVARRRGRLGDETFNQSIAFLMSINVQIDVEGLADVWTRVGSLARKSGLTIYDASYVELASRFTLPLATADKAMRRAAQAEGIEVL